MKKRFCIIMVGICSFLLCACANLKHVEELEKWDCTVTCAEESDDAYIITYSDEKIISNTGTLSFQNRNEFDIVVHLFANGQEERTSEIAAGGVFVLYEIAEGTEYVVGCHADVAAGTEIKLMVYDGEKTEVYSD